MNSEDAKLIEDKIPGKCRRVFELMVQQGLAQRRSLRVIDVQRVTGHNSDEQRLRELRNMFPGLIRVHHCTDPGRGGFWHEYQLSPHWKKLLRGERGK